MFASVIDMSIHHSRKWFTLVELLISLVVFAIMFATLFTLFIRMIRMKTEVEGRSTLIQTTYDLVEKVNNLLQNYTIDYEEYFNRQMVGCNLNSNTTVAGTDGMTIAHAFVRNTQENVDGKFSDLAGNGRWGLWSCDTWTAYGNESANVSQTVTPLPYLVSHFYHNVYSCFIPQETDSPNAIPIQEGLNTDRLSIGFAFDTPETTCAMQLFNAWISNSYRASADYAAWVPFRQAYGQYAASFIDVRADVDDKIWRAWDDDDTNIGKGLIAIQDPTHVQELYLISKDKKKRLFLRRKLLDQVDYNGDGVFSGFESRYAVQMLQLKAFDAGSNHDFNTTTSSGVYDGIIDTRACDTDAWYVCQWPALGTSIYAAYRLPADSNDGWVNITSDEIAITDRNFEITPVKNPDMSWGEQASQLNPYVRFALHTSMYGKKWYEKIGKQVERVTFDLQTAFNVKTHY
jgi:prepilin-type N-terminal cleavage/methylation domain-containing protein